ncbi:MAG: tetratricopeptide repeat protein, partial [Gemmatimonadota bacterium]
AGEARWDPSRLESLRAALAAGSAEGFRWRIRLVQDWPFFLAPVDVRGALLDIFADYPFPEPERAESLARIQAHYDSTSASLGFRIEPPDLVLTLAANGMMQRQAYPAALEVLHRLVELYPSSLNGPWNLANVHRLMGDTATAIRYYEECLRRDPNLVPAQEWLRRLRGGG